MQELRGTNEQLLYQLCCFHIERVALRVCLTYASSQAHEAYAMFFRELDLATQPVVESQATASSPVRVLQTQKQGLTLQRVIRSVVAVETSKKQPEKQQSRRETLGRRRHTGYQLRLDIE